ncbi:MAG: histidine kinase [Ferruginibacter sp.]
MMNTAHNFSATTTINPLLNFITGRKYRWLRHLLFIVIGLLLSFKGDIGMSNDMRTPAIMKAVIIADTISFVFIMSMLYLMMWVLIPKLLFRSKYFLFFLSFFLMDALIFLAVWLIDLLLLRPVDPGNGSMNMQHIEFSFLHFIELSLVSAVLLGSVVGFSVFKKWITDVQRMNELQQMNLKSELEQLKSQVNPHFLFNTLNNVIVLIQTDPPKASQVLLGLSDLLRYQLYDSTKEKISLSKDIAFIDNLLTLEKIRKDDFVFDIHTEGNKNGIMLPPFLFIPFVENGIKHGASSVGHSYLKLNFRITATHIYFYCENSKPAIKQSLVGGLGLKNIVRRLELLYPGNYKLDIKDETAKYIIYLTIPL